MKFPEVNSWTAKNEVIDMSEANPNHEMIDSEARDAKNEVIDNKRRYHYNIVSQSAVRGVSETGVDIVGTKWHTRT